MVEYSRGGTGSHTRQVPQLQLQPQRTPRSQLEHPLQSSPGAHAYRIQQVQYCALAQGLNLEWWVFEIPTEIDHRLC